MFHVEQFFLEIAFHVKQKHPKTHCLVGFLRVFVAKK